ncbi:MAG TPA: hypothetical protein VGR73_10190 [Bryobacteraceae bacterium]|nr:hypothetical protein [Bryobacteraceae bacterium]
MFFRNAKPKVWTFDDRLASLTQAGFSVSRDTTGGTARITRGGFGAAVEDKGSGNVAIGKAGLLVGNEIAVLVNGGYQMFLRTPSGKELPALASHLTALHAFDEDLREALGLTSLYNLALGTTSEAHMYDRVVDRDRPSHPHPWEK